MDMEFQTSLSIDQAVRSLQAAIDEPPLPIVELRSKIHLAGQVKAERVILHRERGRSTSYGQFEGWFSSDGDATRLIGRYVRQSTGVLGSPGGFPIFLGCMFIFLAAVRWNRHQEVGLVFGGMLAVTIGAIMLWLRARSARDEEELLRDKIARCLTAV